MATFVQPPDEVAIDSRVGCASCSGARASPSCINPLLQFSVTIFAIVCGFCVPVPAAQLSNQSRHVVVVVWDGMRPDFVSEQNTPALWKLAREGITFRNHHAVYPSATMVNGTALVTGIYPGKNGIVANHVYRPDIDLHHTIDVELQPVVKKGDELSGGKYISVLTIAELVQRAGGRTVIAAAKTVGLLLDRHAGLEDQVDNANRSASPLDEGEGISQRDAVRRQVASCGDFRFDHRKAWSVSLRSSSTGPLDNQSIDRCSLERRCAGSLDSLAG